MKKALLARFKSGGFTMIELLIVIAILGILAVMVLAAINPLEQINRGRDTAKRGDAEQLLGAFERYNAFNGYFPWQENQSDTVPTAIALDMTLGGGMVNLGWLANGAAGCEVLGRLSTTTKTGCVGTDELKQGYVTRVDDAGGGAGATAVQPRALYTWFTGVAGANAYVCFSPQSQAFRNEANDRCTNTTTPLPADLIGAAAVICPATATTLNAAGEAGVPMICVP